MLKEKNPLIKLELRKKKFKVTKIILEIFESFYELFDLILENPIENFWYEFIGLIIGYLQINYYAIDKTVSN